MQSGCCLGHFHWESKNVLITASEQDVLKYWGGFMETKESVDTQHKANTQLLSSLSSVHISKYVQRDLDGKNDIFTEV
jgi:hypothetical protein